VRQATVEAVVSFGVIEQIGKDAALDWVRERNRGDWPVRGPRGGRYLAPAGQPTRWDVDEYQFWVQGAVRYIGTRRQLRYVRPNSPAANLFRDG
jgi:hypothetical protein